MRRPTPTNPTMMTAFAARFTARCTIYSAATATPSAPVDSEDPYGEHGAAQTDDTYGENPQAPSVVTVRRRGVDVALQALPALRIEDKQTVKGDNDQYFTIRGLGVALSGAYPEIDGRMLAKLDGDAKFYTIANVRTDQERQTTVFNIASPGD